MNGVSLLWCLMIIIAFQTECPSTISISQATVCKIHFFPSLAHLQFAGISPSPHETSSNSDYHSWLRAINAPEPFSAPSFPPFFMSCLSYLLPTSSYCPLPSQALSPSPLVNNGLLTGLCTSRLSSHSHQLLCSPERCSMPSLSPA